MDNKEREGYLKIIAKLLDERDNAEAALSRFISITKFDRRGTCRDLAMAKAYATAKRRVGDT